MSSTRHKQTDDLNFYQECFASSPELNHGLAANLVAKRCSVLKDTADRQLVWFVQYLSHQDGGLAAFSRELIGKYQDQIQTREMMVLRLKRGQACSEAQSKKIIDGICRADLVESRKEDRRIAECCFFGKPEPVREFFKECMDAANLNLEKALRGLCLDATSSLKIGPWYFPTLVEVLRDEQRLWAKQKAARVVTSVGRAVCEAIEYTASTGGLALANTALNVGAKYAARNLCEQQPGQLRFCEVPPTNDDASFVRAIGRSLGGSWLNYKNTQIKERIELALKSGDLTLVLWNAQNLWPQKNLREAAPGRLQWIMSLTDSGARVCMISGPQFFLQRRTCEKVALNTNVFASQISATYNLPDYLSVEELAAVAKEVMPAASVEVCEVMAIFATGSERYLASVEAVAKRAKYLADKSGRVQPSAADINQATEFVSQSDACLADAIAKGQEINSRKRSQVQTPAPVRTQPPAPIPARESMSRCTDISHTRGAVLTIH